MIFGRHDLMQDAPISRLDLLICRNTLMYFTTERSAGSSPGSITRLKDEGYLFLGRAEMLLSHPGLFKAMDIKRRVFSKVARPGYPIVWH